MSVDPADFRTVIGHFATGVTVITAASEGRLHGMTANAFTSLSLDPVMVLVCVDKTTHAHPMLMASGAYVVNVLGEDQEHVSRIFAVRGEPEQGTLRGVEFKTGRTGAPVLSDCLAYMECEVAEVLDGGDHSIFLGRVVDEAVVREVKPLLFFRGGYHSLP